MDNADTLVELNEVKRKLKQEVHKDHHSELDILIENEMAKTISNMSMNRAII